MTKPNESAFPCPMGGDWPECDRGITTRELFAAMAMQGIAANPEFAGTRGVNVAVMAVAQADALLAELAKPQVPHA